MKAGRETAYPPTQLLKDVMEGRIDANFIEGMGCGRLRGGPRC